MRSEYSEAFITDIDSSVVSRKVPSVLLEPVRKEHHKIREVVESFRNKVDNLIDKQRHEYIQAYENHMQDVQRELHSLREKVAEIANDDTQQEKTHKLNSDQIKFKNEAIKLEADSDELRKNMRTLVRKIYSVEKGRDWLLKKLRQAKKKYNFLIKERARVFEDFDANISQASLSNASSYTLELKAKEQQLGPIKTGKMIPGSMHISDPQARVNLDFNVTRPSVLSQHIIPWDTVVNVMKPSPHLQQPSNTVHNNNNNTNTLSPNSRLKKQYSVKEMNNYTHYNNELLEKESLGELISARLRRKEIREFVSLCGNSLHKGPWSRVKKRPLPELLEACLRQIESTNNFENSKEVLQLACELAATPECYTALMELVTMPPYDPAVTPSIPNNLVNPLFQVEYSNNQSVEGNTYYNTHQLRSNSDGGADNHNNNDDNNNGMIMSPIIRGGDRQNQHYFAENGSHYENDQQPHDIANYSPSSINNNNNTLRQSRGVNINEDANQLLHFEDSTVMDHSNNNHNNNDNNDDILGIIQDDDDGNHNEMFDGDELQLLMKYEEQLHLNDSDTDGDIAGGVVQQYQQRQQQQQYNGSNSNNNQDPYYYSESDGDIGYNGGGDNNIDYSTSREVSRGNNGTHSKPYSRETRKSYGNSSGKNTADSSGSELVNQFKYRLNSLTQMNLDPDDEQYNDNNVNNDDNNNSNNNTSQLKKDRLLDHDVLLYFKQEKHQKKLRDSGFYDKDDFLDFD